MSRPAGTTARSGSSVRAATSIDPSLFLPAIEEHLGKLRVEREHALSVNAAEWVVRNYDDQITAYKRVAEAMHKLVEGLPQEQKRIVDIPQNRGGMRYEE